MVDSSRLTDIKAGAFVLVALALLIVGSLWIAGAAFFGTQRVPYRVLMKNSGGVQVGDRVRVSGVAVGKVQDVNLHPDEEWPVAFEVLIRREVPIRGDASAIIASSGLLGTAFLQVDPGSPDAPALPPGGEILGRPTAGIEDAMARVGEISERAIGLMEQASGILEQMSGELGPLLARATTLLDEENVEHVGGILANLDTTLAEAGPRLAGLLTQLESVSESASAGMERMPDLADRIDALVSDLQAALGPDGARLASALDAAQLSLGSANDTLEVLSENRGELGAAVRDLRDSAANLKALSQTLKERPYSLVRVKPEPSRKPGEGAK
jgi:phospholipid/cholesterol/gamma-HCH transport system substrate-binding protein